MRRIALALVLLAACERKPVTAPEPDAAASILPAAAARESAPSFDGATAWLDVERPLAPADLDGRVTVVDFWTSCCINCLHTLPVLAELEKRHAKDALVVVGVHSPKFDAETENERLRAAIAENGITHPVAVDGSMKIWQRWHAQAWPTIFVLDAHRRIVWASSGEPDRAKLEAYVQAALDEGAREGSLTKQPFALARPQPSDTGPLAFPGKVIALADGGLAVSDTGHNRVVFLDASLAPRDVVGTGLAGATDGAYAEASFKKPQGLAEAGDLVYVADTENHELRVIDRKSKTVRTVAGTGALGQSRLVVKGKGREIALRSPWDLAVVKDSIYVALAGSHQIALFDPKDGTIAPFAGSGAERRIDGTGDDSAFAQPSGLATDGTTLWVADSETSSLRAIDLATRAVKTLVGKDLFVFGDVDGSADVARFEHPLGVAFGSFPPKSPNALFVADTYNSKIRRIDLATNSTRSLFGARSHEQLFEPSAVVLRKGELVVADAKHHRIVRLAAKGDEIALTAIDLKGLAPPQTGVAVAAAAPAAPSERIEAPEVAVRATGGTVRVKWKAPAGTGVNEEAPFKVRWNRSEGLSEAPPEMKSTGATVKDGFAIPLKPMQGVPRATLDGEIDLVVCDVATHKVCVPVRRALELGFVVTDGAPAEPTLDIVLPEAKAR